MNPIDFAARVLRDMHGDRQADPGPVAELASEAREVAPTSYRPDPALVTAFESGFRARAADEAIVLERLAVETARVGPWEAARTLFAPNTPCAGLYATQTPASAPSHVSVSPEPQKPAQPLP
ncbi:hypothetical protein FLW53_09455 [Microbispora sp. SCL1-1]|uniref:hypothetical protein n=1 Tax=unclassified Microbispora TaxID=2614687 RepID=UPI00115BD9F4|nr:MULTISPECIES: hypothetical protein [unclassified Microbispora]NJP24428.1 hypothetical protein [Microbispora sp. CL1-1]TQS14578.1 hypothetical protein FLW53_09455 [Microbispora sp. SCL1-1]